MNTLTGLGIAPGRGLAPAVWLRVDEPVPSSLSHPLSLEEVRLRVVEQIQSSQSHAESQVLQDVLQAHCLIADDPELWRQIQEKVDANVPLFDAIQAVVEETARRFAEMDDEYWRARADDVRDVGRQLLAAARGHDPHGVTQWPGHPFIVVAEVLYPSDTARLPLHRVRGFVLRQGSWTSHVAILSRSHGIPAVVLGDAVDALASGQPLYIDGDTGIIVVDPDESLAREDVARVKWPVQHSRVCTGDGTELHIEANIGSLADAVTAHEMGCDGVGLLRTEFLFDGETAPSQSDQTEVLSQICEALHGKPMVVRLADIGGDKPLPYLDWPEEQNPFLGVRAIRLLSRYPHLYDDQIRAVYEVGRHFPVRLMFPMIATLEDWRLCRNTVIRVVEASGYDVNTVPLGCMIEVPSAVWLADRLAREAEFFSIGTNDLIQYLFAADRLSPDLAHYYQPLNPAVLRAVGTVIEVGVKSHIPVAMCGEMAGDPTCLEILVGMGLRSFSVAAPLIPETKGRITQLEMDHCRQAATAALGGTAD